LFKDSKV